MGFENHVYGVNIIRRALLNFPFSYFLNIFSPKNSLPDFDYAFYGDGREGDVEFDESVEFQNFFKLLIREKFSLPGFSTFPLYAIFQNYTFKFSIFF